jgi:hypothetical protein
MQGGGLEAGVVSRGGNPDRFMAAGTQAALEVGGDDGFVLDDENSMFAHGMNASFRILLRSCRLAA